MRFYNNETLAKREKIIWNGFSLICPDMTGDKDLVIKGSKFEMISNIPAMTVRRCDNSTLKSGELQCHSEDEIDEYISDM